MSLTKEFADKFVHHWINSWNNKDLDGCSNWLDEHVETTSNYIASLFPDSYGHIRGKESLLKYFSIVLEKMPNFKLKEPVHNIVGNTIMLTTLNAANNKTALIGYSFTDEGKIIEIKASL